MEIIAKISKGSKMDQIYLPKQRAILNIGEYAVITPLHREKEKKDEKLYFYGIKDIEPIKLEIISRIISIIESNIDYENIIVTGSFLNKGFNFNDIDLLILTEEDESQGKTIQKRIEEKLKINTHLILLSDSSFKKALEIDPVWRMITSKSISKRRIPPLPRIKLDYKYLDAQLIKSKTLIDNFDNLYGKDKYKLIRNAVAIYLFIHNKPISDAWIEKEILKELGTTAEDLKNNLIGKNISGKYRTFHLRLEREVIENATKQEKAH